MADAELINQPTISYPGNGARIRSRNDLFAECGAIRLFMAECWESESPYRLSPLSLDSS